MKRRTLIIAIGIVGIIVLVIVGWYVMFVHFGRGPAFPFLKVQKMNVESANQVMIADNSLMAEAETEADAQEIAEQYGIHFTKSDRESLLLKMDVLYIIRRRIRLK